VEIAVPVFLLVEQSGKQEHCNGCPNTILLELGGLPSQAQSWR
jgi:hypothetical protein